MHLYYDRLKGKNVASYLLLTVTDIEMVNVLSLLEPIGNCGFLTTVADGQTYHIGRYGKVNVIVTKCADMGTVEAGSSMMTTQAAISHWPCIKAVIMVGIAFGMYDDADTERQHYGDVLVSTSIISYENQRVGESEIKHRGKTHHADGTLLKALSIVQSEWQENNLYGEATRVELCQMLTGEKLVDNREFRDTLRAQFADTRGGEMEGMGVACPAEKNNLPWLIIKAICDFGHGKNRDDKDMIQACAAYLSARACYRALQETDTLSPIHEWKNAEFVYHPDKTEVKKSVFFLNYDPSKEPFYLRRPLDDKLEKLVRMRGFWISGETGVGKTTALMRALMRSGRDFLIINMAAHAHKSVTGLFVHIYSMICSKVGETPRTDISSNHSIVEKIQELMLRHYQGSELVLVLEEIPISGKDSELFREFAETLFAMLIMTEDDRYVLKVVLSSIASPRGIVPDYQSKALSRMELIDMPRWSNDDCLKLTEMIKTAIPFVWTGYSEERFVEDCQLSPRTIKDRLRDYYDADELNVSRSNYFDI